MKMNQQGADRGMSMTLAQAVQGGKTKTVRKLLDKGCDPNCRLSDDTGTPLLIYAVKNKYIDCARELLRFRAHVNATGEGGMTPCLYAADSQNLEMLKLLVEYTADLTACNDDGTTALMLAAQWGSCECLQFLFNLMKTNLDSEINKTDHVGRTALIYAAQIGRHVCVRPLIDAGADVRLVDSEGFSALMYALKHREFECAKILLKAKPDITVVSVRDKETALSLALQESDFGIIETLLEQGADMSTSKRDQYFLHEMVARNQRNIIRLMVMNDCPPLKRKCYQQYFKFCFPHIEISPIAVALLSGFVEIARYFIINYYFTTFDLLTLPENMEIRDLINKSVGGKLEKEVAPLLDYLRTIARMMESNYHGELEETIERDWRKKAILQNLCTRQWHVISPSEERPRDLTQCHCTKCQAVGGVTFQT